MKVVEICAGAGGQSLGLHHAGFTHEVAIELDTTAAETLRSNLARIQGRSPDVRVGDVADENLWCPEEYEGIDLLAGGVPCQSYEEYLYQGGERLKKDLFDDGYVDHAIFQPAHLGEFYKTGFGQTDEAFALAQANPGKLTYNHHFDPRNGEAGLDQLRADHEKMRFKGVKLYTAEWHGDSRGWKLTDPWAYRYFEACRELGITNIHVHKGPRIRPLDRDAFDVADIDGAATDFTDLNFIVEHVGLPRLEDFCWIATQEPNVYGGLAVAMPFIHTSPKYFGQILGELLYWIGEDRIFFSSDYAIWTPKWLVEAFVDFEMPAELTEYAPITLEQKKKILGLNAAKMYGLDVPAELRLPDAKETETGPREAEADAQLVNA